MLFNAAILEELNKPFAVRKIETPKYLSVGQVLVKIVYSGVCGAQLGEQSGVKGPDKYLPHLVGHEGSGTVVACGPGVKHVKPRDHVVMHWRKGIGIECEPPKYWCPALGKEIGGGWVTTFQEYSVVSENRLTKIPDNIQLDIAALLGCAVTTGLGLVTNEVQLKPGQSILVIGCGGVGLNIIQGASLVSGYPINAVDLIESKLKKAREFGATGAYISFDGFLPHDVVVDTTGNPGVIERAWQLTATTGTLCLVAQIAHDKQININTLAMHSGKKFIGSDGGGTNPTVDIPRYIRLLEAGKLNLQSLITHVAGLQEVNDIFAEIRASRVGRALIKLQT